MSAYSPLPDVAVFNRPIDDLDHSDLIIIVCLGCGTAFVDDAANRRGFDDHHPRGLTVGEHAQAVGCPSCSFADGSTMTAELCWGEFCWLPRNECFAEDQYRAFLKETFPLCVGEGVSPLIEGYALRANDRLHYETLLSAVASDLQAATPTTAERKAICAALEHVQSLMWDRANYSEHPEALL